MANLEEGQAGNLKVLGFEPQPCHVPSNQLICLNVFGQDFSMVSGVFTNK